jgi:pimeloyl-ACP methyl ester carboxylesterase
LRLAVGDHKHPRPIIGNPIGPVLCFARFAWQFPDDPRLAGYLYRVKVPTLIVWGERDGVVPPAHGRAYQAEIAGAELAILPNCGHLPMVEQPEVFVQTVLAYLERIGASA